MKTSSLVLIVTTALVFSLCAVCTGKTITVNVAGGADFTSIQAAIEDAGTVTGDEIQVAPGTYTEAINFLGKAIRLYSSGGATVTTINGTGRNHVVECISGEGPGTIIEGFTITGGNATGSYPDYSGGGMYNSGSSPTVTNCTFTGNTAYAQGGGMYNHYSSPTVTNCTFTGNTVSIQGGGMYNHRSSPTVTNCTFISNEANTDGGGAMIDGGGGMYNVDSSPTLTYCTFSDNKAGDNGGGLFNFNGSNPILTDCTFSDNLANYGGGMYNDGSSPTVTDCTFISNEASTDNGGGIVNYAYSSPRVTDCAFVGNTASSGGGGMYNWFNSNPILTDCTFVVNTAFSGGGMYTYESSPTVTNCTFSNNEAYAGGGMLNYQCGSMVANCTFVGNTASSGGGMYNSSASPTVGPTVTNCILWANRAPAAGPEIYNYQSSPIVTCSDIQGGYAGTGNINADPLFIDAAGGDFRLGSSASPCVDAGNNSVVTEPTDLAGNPRVVDGDLDGTAIVDMGAYELQPKQIHNITQDTWHETIQPAIDYSNNDDQVEIGPGTYTEAINFKGKAIHLYSSGGPAITTINGTGNNHVVQCISGEGPGTILEGFTITGGHATGTYPDNDGGGMYNNQSSPTVKNCIFTGNAATNAGAMYNLDHSSPTLNDCTFTASGASIDGGGIYNDYYCSPTLTNCTFSANTAGDNGGGMFNFNHSNPILTDCTFIGNTAIYGGGGMINDYNSSPTLTRCTFRDNTDNNSGGGMYNYNNCSPTLIDCTFVGNGSGFRGGGMQNWESSPTVTHCTFSGNSSQYIGGGIFNYKCSPTVTNCIFVGNSAVYGGGGIFNDLYSSPAVTNCTFSANSAGDTGGGIFNYNYCNPIITNCILWANTAPTNPQIYNYLSSPIVTYSDIQGGYSGTGNINIYPLFVDAGDGDFHLQAGSACIDAGNNSAVPAGITTDAAGLPRYINGKYCSGSKTVDMGPLEYSRRYQGDLNDDCIVNLADFGILSNHWDSFAIEADIASVYGDGVVDLLDLAILSSHWLEEVQ